MLEKRAINFLLVGKKVDPPRQYGKIVLLHGDKPMMTLFFTRKAEKLTLKVHNYEVIVLKFQFQ